jgi:hypothetical protein
MFLIPKKLQKTTFSGNKKCTSLKKCMYLLKKRKQKLKIVLGHVSTILDDSGNPPGHRGTEGGQVFLAEALGLKLHERVIQSLAVRRCPLPATCSSCDFSNFQ